MHHHRPSSIHPRSLFCTIHHVNVGTVQLCVQVYCMCDEKLGGTLVDVTHLSLTHSPRLLSCRCHRHKTLIFFVLPRRVWLHAMGVATDATHSCLFVCFFVVILLFFFFPRRPRGCSSIALPTAHTWLALIRLPQIYSLCFLHA